LENAYYRAEKIPSEYDWHHPHNLSLLASCLQLLGQMKEAERLLRQAYALPAHGEAAELGRRQWPEFLLARGRPQEAFDAAQVLAAAATPTGRFVGHTLAGRALAAMNRVEEAKTEFTAASQELRAVTVDADRLQPYLQTLEAEILLSQKKSAEGVALMKQILEQLRGTPGPDARSQALLQMDSIARRARETDEWALAEFTAQEMIGLDPSYGGGYYALGLVAEQQGDAAAATQKFAIAEKLWSEADKDLPELQAVRQKLASKQSELPQTRQQCELPKWKSPMTPRGSAEARRRRLSLSSSRIFSVPSAEKFRPH